MKNEIKISLPSYKIACSFCFIVILSLIRGLTYSYEIGIASEASVAILALVFCGDTYTMEIVSKRSEVYPLYPMRKRVFSQYKRLWIQIAFLFVMSLALYGMFQLFQQPVLGMMGQETAGVAVIQNEIYLFLSYMVAIIVTISFWGILSNTLACLCRNMWGGIGGSMLLVISMNSKAGDMLLGKWSPFSYTFREIRNNNDFSWLWGKGICICLTVILMWTLPFILKKRG